MTVVVVRDLATRSRGSVIIGGCVALWVVGRMAFIKHPALGFVEVKHMFAIDNAFVVFSCSRWTPFVGAVGGGSTYIGLFLSFLRILLFHIFRLGICNTLLIARLRACGKSMSKLTTVPTDCFDCAGSKASMRSGSGLV